MSPSTCREDFWKCRVSTWISIYPVKTSDFLKSVIKEEECGYLWQLAGSGQVEVQSLPNHHWPSTSLTHSFWGATSVTVGWDPLDMHSPVSSSLFSLLPILQKWYVLSCSRIHDELGGEGPPCRRGSRCLLMLAIDLVWVSSSRIHSPMCPQEKFISPSISFANLVSFVWPFLFLNWFRTCKRGEMFYQLGTFEPQQVGPREQNFYVLTIKKHKQKKKSCPIQWNIITILVDSTYPPMYNCSLVFVYILAKLCFVKT